MTNIWEFLLQTLTVTIAAGLLLVIKELLRDKLSPRWQYGITIRTGRPPMGISSEDAMELQALYRRVVEGLLDYGVLMLHSSAIAVDEELI